MRRGSDSGSKLSDDGNFSGSLTSVTSGSQSVMASHRGHANRTSPRRNQAIGKESSLNLIDVDLARTFPTLRLFGEEGAYHNRPERS